LEDISMLTGVLVSWHIPAEWGYGLK